MALVTANLTWDPVSGSTGYLIEYRLSGDIAWIMPLSPQNPTLLTTYSIIIETNTFYDVRISSSGASCSSSSRTLQIFAPAGVCCPPTFTLSLDGTYCYKTTTTAATPPSSPENTVATPFFNYGAYGTVVYDPGYNAGGYGPFTLIPLTNTFWNNQTLTTVDGPNNRTALWATTTSDNQDVGFSYCVTLPSDGIYYVGCFADNYIKINLDGNNLVSMDVTNMAAYFEANGYPGIGPSVTFYLWHVYPIFLPSGNHVIEIIGHNESFVAGMGGEIYNATLADLLAATSYVDLGAKLIFSTKDVIGDPVQIGTGGAGYTCPVGYSLILCDGPAYCTKTETVATIDCLDVLPVYYGTNLTGVTPIEVEILAGSTISIDASNDVPIDWTPFNGSPAFCWFAIPDLGAAWLKNQWFVDTVNQGAIGGISNLFGDPVIVSVSGDNYNVWITNYGTQFVQICILQQV